MKEIAIDTEFVTLGQLLKLAGEITTGGEVKEYLRSHTPLVNGEPDNRRGRKIRPGDLVVLEGCGEISCVSRQ